MNIYICGNTLHPHPDLENTPAEIASVGVSEIGWVVNSTDLTNTPAEIGRVGVSQIGRVVNSTDLENT